MKSLDDCNDVVTRAQVMQIFQYGSLDALYRAIQRRRFPAPDLKQPMRWSRERLRRWWADGQQTPPAGRLLRKVG